MAICRSVIVNVVKTFEIRGHLLVVDVETTNDLTRVINVYAPNNASEQKAFFQAVDTCCTDQMLLLGDFNSVLCACNHASQHHDGTTTQLLNLISKWSLIEPEGSHLNSFTYHHPSIPGHKSHIDRIHSNIPQNKLRGFVVPVTFSNHYAVATFLMPSNDLGPRP